MCLVFFRLWQPFPLRCVGPFANMLPTEYADHVHSINYIWREVKSKKTGKCLRCECHVTVQYKVSRTDAL